MVKTPKRAQIPPMNLPNPEMGVEVPGETHKIINFVDYWLLELLYFQKFFLQDTALKFIALQFIF